MSIRSNTAPYALLLRRMQIGAALAAVATFMALPAHCAGSAPGLETVVGQTGLTTLSYNGTNLLGNGDVSIQSVDFQGTNGTLAPGSASPTATANDGPNTVIETYSWGRIRCAYTAAGSRLNLSVAVTNTSPAKIQQLTLQLMSLHFPQAPQGWVHDYAYVGSNTGDPTVVTADYGAGALAVCNDEIAKPLLLGFPGRASLTDRPLVISTAKGWYLSPYLDSQIARPIASGATDTYHVSLRFGPSGSSDTALASDVYAKFAAAYPQTLDWTDRRPIGTLHLAVSEADHHTAKNPRGWFQDPNGVDVTTEAGRVQFRARVLKYADDSIAVLKATGAQGMIVWDLEGEQYPQATTYIGDPRLLSKLDPEMDPVADAFFQKFKAAGLKTGLCIRPQQLVVKADGTAFQQELTDPKSISQLLLDKMLYANARWGCTLFYVDSNGDPNVPYDVTIFKAVADQLAARKIRALIMPEHQNTRYYAYTAPYDELRGGVTTTPQKVRSVYPNAFTALYAPDGPIDEKRAALVQAVSHGDVLLFRGWWPDDVNPKVHAIYQDAKR